MKPYGPMNFQLKFTKNGPMIFEINPRFSGTTPIREKFGLNEYTAISKTLFSRQKFYYKLKKGVVIKYLDEFFTSKKKFEDVRSI